MKIGSFVVCVANYPRILQIQKQFGIETIITPFMPVEGETICTVTTIGICEECGEETIELEELQFSEDGIIEHTHGKLWKEIDIPNSKGILDEVRMLTEKAVKIIEPELV